MARGRPKSDKPKKDLGTIELQNKRAQHSTQEPLDFMLEKGNITSEQHKAGIYFRWLYSLIFGSTSLSANDPSDLGGRYPERHTDEKWLTVQKERYYEAMKMLKNIRADKLVMDTCIFSEAHWLLDTSYHAVKNNLLLKIGEGLDSLVQKFRIR